MTAAQKVLVKKVRRGDSSPPSSPSILSLYPETQLFPGIDCDKLVVYLSAMSIDFPAEEEAVLKRWREIDAFRRQVELSRGRKPYSKRLSLQTPKMKGSLTARYL
jgi:hypothetical protein